MQILQRAQLEDLRYLKHHSIIVSLDTPNTTYISNPRETMEVLNPCEILMLWPLAKWVCIGAVVLHVAASTGWLEFYFGFTYLKNNSFADSFGVLLCF